MRVEIGPVSRASAQAWLDYCSGVVTEFVSATPPTIPLPALETFTELIEGWRLAVTAAARQQRPFHWIGEAPADRVEFLMKALYETGVAVERDNESGGMGLRPAAADEFHFVLLDQVLTALEHESRSNAEFVATLRNDWRAARPK